MENDAVYRDIVVTVPAVVTTNSDNIKKVAVAPNIDKKVATEDTVTAIRHFIGSVIGLNF